MTDRLFTPFNLYGLPVKNRMVLAPMTRARAGKSRVPNALMCEYYSQRAGAGLLLTEATVISDQANGWNESAGIYTDEMEQGWKTVTSAVHAAGAPIFLQLWHCGRASHSSFHADRSLPVAASAIAIEGDGIHTPEGKQPYEVPRALETHEIPGIVADYQRAAARALAAGFDGVEIHGANGYLLDNFLQSTTNQRTDEYGGSIEKRFRLMKEVVEAVVQVWPANRVGLRLSPNGIYNSMGAPDFREQFLDAAQRLDAYGLAYLHVMDGLAFGFHQRGEPMTLAEFRQVFKGPLIGNCGYTKDTAEAAIANGHADMIAFGRPFISNPDLPARLQHGWPLNADADVRSWYHGASEGYTDFPRHA